jgi:NifU-like protein involved in Fe-S cluster formation/predicted N-acetyltransferase YhbS
MPDADLYQRSVIEHGRSPRNFGPLPGHTHAGEAAHAMCGDALRAELRCASGRIAELHFAGVACTVATASASMLSERAPGLDAAALADLRGRFERLVRGEIEGDASLGPLNAFAPLARHSSRRVCALLAWNALGAALDDGPHPVAESALADLSFRAALPRDIEAVVALVESAYRGESSRGGWTTEADLLDGRRIDAERVAELVAGPASRVLLAEHGGALVACAQIERQGANAYFGMFSVRPVLQGAGVGRAVLAQAERIARAEWQCRTMRMTVISVREELIAWYQRRGYRRTGVYEPFPYGDERFGIPRRDDLRFEVLLKDLA